METIEAQEEEGFSLNLYPNPVESVLNIEYFSKEENSTITVSIYNLMGEKVLEIQEKSTVKGINTAIINFSGNDKFALIPAGIYLCNVNIEGQSRTSRILIQK
jgi:hypothetical protein